MKFAITKSEKWTEGSLLEASEPYIAFDWELVRADGSAVCRSGHDFPDEQTTRSDIADAKRSMKGAWRAKVEVA